MNPLSWKKEHQIALALAILVGIAIGIVIGYLVYASAKGAGGAISFAYWVRHPIRFSGTWWGFLGGTVGGALIYIRHLTSN